MSEQYFFSTVWETISSEGSSQSTRIDCPNMRSSPSGPSNRPLGPMKPRLAREAPERSNLRFGVSRHLTMWRVERFCHVVVETNSSVQKTPSRESSYFHAGPDE